MPRSHVRYALCVLVVVLTAVNAPPTSAQGPAAPASTLSEREQGVVDVDEISGSELWASGRYRLTPSDVLELTFPYVPEFNQTLSVQPDGYITLRAVGDLRVQGRTLPDLRQMLYEAYSPILREPVITVVLRDFEKPYFVAAGEVKNPGKFELRGLTTVTQALALAGGHTESGKLSQVILFRRYSRELLEVKQIDVKRMLNAKDLSEDPLLRPGDTLFVPKSVVAQLGRFITRPQLGLYLNPFHY